MKELLRALLELADHGLDPHTHYLDEHDALIEIRHTITRALA